MRQKGGAPQTTKQPNPAQPLLIHNNKIPRIPLLIPRIPIQTNNTTPNISLILYIHANILKTRLISRTFVVI